MEVKPGYQRTTVGVIPADWNTFTLEEVSDRISVGLATSVTKYYRKSGVPIVRNLNIKDGYFDGSDMLFISKEFAKANSSKAARAFDVLTVHTGANLGQTCVLPCEFDHCQTFTTLITRPKKDIADSAFLCLHMSSFFGRTEMKRLEVGGGKGNLNTGDLKKYRISLPPFPEQQAIAKVLSDVDVLLNSLDRLINKKHDLKQAAMQQLLTGKRRLPGFSGAWQEFELSSLGTFSKGRGIKKDQVIPDGKPCVRYGEIYTHHNDFVRTFNSFISSSVANESHRLQKGDLLFAGSGETAEEIGKCVAFLGDEEAYAGGDIVILTPSDQDSMYLGYLMNHESIRVQKARMGQGDAVVHISAGNLGQIRLRVPKRDEQSAIAAVISDMDAEIATVETRRNKTRDLKQSMMQELLTGKTRLV